MSNSSFSRLGAPLEKEAFLQRTVDNAWNGVRDNFVNPVYNTGTNLARGAAGVVENMATFVPRAVYAGGSGGISASGGLGGAVQSVYDGVSDSLDHSYDSAVDSLNRMTSSPWMGPSAPTVPAPPVSNPLMGPPAPTAPAPLVSNPLIGPPAPTVPAPLAPPLGTRVVPRIASAALPQMTGRPTPSQMRRFSAENYRGGRGSYDPNSRVDRAKMQQLMGKSAGKLDGLLTSGRGLFDQAHTAVKGYRAAAMAYPKVQGFTDGAKRLKSSLVEDLTPMKQLALTGAGLATTGFVGHQIGQNTGKKDGLSVGLDEGVRKGIQAMETSQVGDPGILGRLMAVFAGQQQGPSGASVYNNLQSDKEAMIRAIMAGGQTKKAGVDCFFP